MNEKSAGGVVGIDLYVASLEDYTVDDVLKLQQTFDEIYRACANAKALQKNKEVDSFKTMLGKLDLLIEAKHTHEEALKVYENNKLEWFLDVDNENRESFKDKKPLMTDEYAELFPELKSTEIEEKKMTVVKIAKDFPLLAAENLEDISKGLGKIYQVLKEKTEQEQREHEAKLKQASEDFLKGLDEPDDEEESMPVESTQDHLKDEMNTDVNFRNPIEKWQEEVSKAVPDTVSPTPKLPHDNVKNDAMKTTGWGEWILSLILSVMNWFRGKEETTQSHQEKPISNEAQQETRDAVTSGPESKEVLISRKKDGLSALLYTNGKAHDVKNKSQDNHVEAPSIGGNPYLHDIEKKEKKHQRTSSSSPYPEDSEDNPPHP